MTFAILIIAINLVAQGVNNSVPHEMGTFTDYRDNKIYKTVKIDTQIWFAENLAYNAGGGCIANNNATDPTNYGFLYNWGTSNNVCPSGWHLPSEKEWEVLIDFLGGKYNAPKKMRATTGWQDENDAATNASGFTGLPGGFGGFDQRGFNKKDLGKVGYFASSKGTGTNFYFWAFKLENGDHALDASSVSLGGFIGAVLLQNTFFVSVRCIKN